MWSTLNVLTHAKCVPMAHAKAAEFNLASRSEI